MRTRFGQFLIVIIVILVGALIYAYNNPIQQPISCGLSGKSLTDDNISGLDVSNANMEEIYVDSSTLTAPENQLVIAGSNGAENYFYVEIADTPEKQALGLMHRHRLDANSGMLFLFKGMEKRTFWMKNTYIPLDILFLDENGVVVDIHKNTTPESTDHINSSVPAYAALELNAGSVQHFNLKIGTKIYNSAFK